MRFSPATLTSAQAVLAKKPEIGLESILFLGAVDITLLGRVVVNGAGVASWVPNSGITIPVAGWDLHLRADNAAAGLARLPLLVLTSDDGNTPGADALVAAVRAAGGAVTTAHEATDHSWSDARIALQTRVIGWLQGLR